MLTSKENYLITARGGNPEWVPSFAEETNIYNLPIWNVDPVTKTDFCNVKWMPGDYGEIPDYRWRAIEEMGDWYKVVKFPDPLSLDWSQYAKEFHADSYDSDNVDIVVANTWGIFLAPINMMGWEDGICAIYDDPISLKGFISTFTEYLCELVRLIGEHFQPDIILTGDDLAGEDGPYFSRDVWQEFYKPFYAQILETIHKQGALAEFRCRGDNGYLIEELLDIGCDICHLPIPDENLIADKKRLGNKLVLTGGWIKHDKAELINVSEDVLRASVHEAIDTFGAEGGLIFWDGGVLTNSVGVSQKEAWLFDELHKYGHEVYKTI